MGSRVVVRAERATGILTAAVCAADPVLVHDEIAPQLVGLGVDGGLAEVVIVDDRLPIPPEDVNRSHNRILSTFTS